MSTSVFSFNFRLVPWEGCLGLNFDSLQLAPGFSAVCVRDQLSLLWSGDPSSNDQARATAHTLARRLVHADAFVSFPTGLVLDVEPVTWLELRDSQSAVAVSGYMHPSLATAPLTPSSADAVRFRSSGTLAATLEPHAALLMAMADFHASRREVGPYAAFYAYRALEDVGFYFGATKDDHPKWDEMNRALGTTRAHWDLLTQAGTAARHLSAGKLPALVAADLGALRELAHEAISRALEHIGVAF